MEKQACEVEVKYHVDRLDDLLAAIAARGIALSIPCVQDDQAYAQDGWHYGMSKCGVAFARLRTQGGRHSFTLKKPQDNEMACLEHETEIADRDQMHEALLQMGFYPTVRIVKTRRGGRDGRLSLCVDEVVGLGAFLEIEAMVALGRSGSAVQHELDRFATTFGVPLRRTTDTYDSLVRAALTPA